jgi:hypothetical protein
MRKQNKDYAQSQINLESASLRLARSLRTLLGIKTSIVLVMNLPPLKFDTN